jgi:hypothetical protein
MTAASVAMLELVVLGGFGCGGSSGGHDGPGGVAIQPEVNVQGGTALSAGGQGQAGGVVHLVSHGDVSFDSTSSMTPAAAPPSIPPTPGDASAVDATALGGDVSVPGAAAIAGDVTTGGADATRTIRSGGDLFVTGTLRAADLGGGRQGLTLEAGGTLYVGGTIDASGASGGQAGGAIHLSASRVVITGRLLSSGGDGGDVGGVAGAITIACSQGIAFAGSIEARGGNGNGAGAVTGGGGGALTLTAGGDVSLAGTVLIRGGAATNAAGGGAQGGAGAVLTIDADAAVELGGTIDARGGPASGAGGAVVGGAAGAVRIGEQAAPATIVIRVGVNASGGAGDAAGGAGGTVTAEPDTGNIVVNGPRAIDVSGGDSLAVPGVGGLVSGSPRGDPGSGGFHVAGEVFANGGSIMPGGSGNGAEGGHVTIELVPTDGSVTIDASGKITADGGQSGGAGVAGGGGHVWLFTMDGDLTVAGAISARGGDAADAGGTGGLGGMIYLFSDNNHNAVDVGKGNLLIAETGKLDASGGDGTIGGNARNDGIAGQVAPFPEEQEKFAIFLNCDGQHGETRNWMLNSGILIARGGVHGGSGGDITYHGIGPGQREMDTPPDDGNHHPPGGNQDMAGDGSGQPGDYGAE